jgi:hypothetical protein
VQVISFLLQVTVAAVGVALAAWAYSRCGIRREP